jgi:DNA ligase-1
MRLLKDFPIAEPDLAKKIEIGKQKPPIIWRYPDDFVLQHKYDGIRALSGRSAANPSKYILVSRNDKPLDSESLNHIREGRKDSGCMFPPDMVLDGEVYADVGPREPISDFNELSGIVRRGAADPRKGELYYLIFDAYFPDKPNLSYAERMALVIKYHNKSSPAIKRLYRVVEPISASKLKLPRGSDITEQMIAALEYSESLGYEGIMARNITLPYMSGRAGESLYKLKTMVDEEFKIVGAVEATGQDAGTPVWICETKGGVRFNARPMGTLESRKKMWANRSKIIGKKLTVRFQDKSKDGVPRFPVGVAIRDYE